MPGEHLAVVGLALRGRLEVDAVRRDSGIESPLPTEPIPWNAQFEAEDSLGERPPERDQAELEHVACAWASGRA